MKKVALKLSYIFLIIILANLFSLFIYPIPFEIRSREFNTFIYILFPLSLAGLFLILIIKQKGKKYKLKYLLITVGIIGLIFSLIIIILIRFLGGAIYEDKHVAFQSLDNKSDRIIQQYMDEGALGSHWREVRVKDFCCGIRYSNRFCETTLNGLWIKYDYSSGNVDTLRYDNHIYKSTINKKQNWTTKKCK